MQRTEFDELTPFLDTLKAAGISHVALRTVEEIRPKQDGNSVTVAPQKWATVSAYSQGHLYLVKLTGGDESALRPQLEARGLAIRHRRDNIG